MFYLVHQQTGLLLLAIGALGICWEFLRPGLIAPGVIGSTLVLLAIPADWRLIPLMGAALLLFAVDAIVNARGVFAVLGTIGVGAGAMTITPSFVMAAGFAIPFGLLTTFLLYAAVRARRNKLDGKLRSSAYGR
jgi:membrane-bound ClpP family serine protease